MIIERLVMISILLLTGCTTVVDGEYIQKEGVRIDYSKLASLTVGVSTARDAINIMGPPSNRLVASENKEVLKYVSVRSRTSTEHTLGFSHGKTTQNFTETAVLVFINDILVQKNVDDRIDYD